MYNTPLKAKPFIKWAGGKRKLVPQLSAALPKELYETDFSYYEPFIGGGAFLFYMLQTFKNIKKVLINDINTNVTNAYEVVKNDTNKLVDRLKCIEKNYFELCDEATRKSYYLRMRQQFNCNHLDKTDKTALLIFLNHTCFNGLYRENSKGDFNVPFGKYKRPVICNEEALIATGELLREFDVIITNNDFTEISKQLNNKDLTFVYFDPPYRPLSETSSFTSYVKENFNDKRQEELGLLCRNISKRSNVYWMLTNSDCSSKNPDDTFFETLYEGFDIKRIVSSRSINSKAEKRGKLTELLIRNFTN